MTKRKSGSGSGGKVLLRLGVLVLLALAVGGRVPQAGGACQSRGRPPR